VRKPENARLNGRRTSTPYRQRYGIISIYCQELFSRCACIELQCSPPCGNVTLQLPHSQLCGVLAGQISYVVSLHTRSRKAVSVGCQPLATRILRLLFEFFQSCLDVFLCRPAVLSEEVSLRHLDNLLAAAGNFDLDGPLVDLRGLHFRVGKDLLDEARRSITLLVSSVSVPARMWHRGRPIMLWYLHPAAGGRAWLGVCICKTRLQKVRSNLMPAPVEQARTAVRATSAERADAAASVPDEKDRTAETSGSILRASIFCHTPSFSCMCVCARARGARYEKLLEKEREHTHLSHLP
jgi:hypothetical protein